MDFVRKLLKIDTTHLHDYYEIIRQNSAAGTPKPWVVFVPGVGCGAFLFKEVALRLFAPQFNVLLFNNPGTNGTSCPMWLHVEDVAELLHQVLVHEGVERAFFIGHSMGGYTTQQLAITTPALVEKMVLMSTCYGGSQNRKNLARMSRDVGLDMWEFYRSARGEGDAAIRYTFSDNFPVLQPEKYAQFVAFHQQNWADAHVVQRHFMCGARFSSHGRLADVAAPALVIHGDKDNLLDVEGGRLLAEELPNATYMELADCGHFPFVEREHIWQNILQFLQQ